MSGTTAVSPAAAFSSSPLADAEKADVRRFCGYQTYGAGPAGFQGWRFFQAYGLLEFRMNNLAPAEFQNVRYYLSLLYLREADVQGAAATLGTNQAAVWTRNPHEVRDRRRLYNATRREFCTIVGVAPGPNLGDGQPSLVV